MSVKRDGQQIAADFMEGAIKVIARDGFDKASTRNIAKECGLADAYIYHYYKDKDDLLSRAFQKEDAALAAKVKQHLPVMRQPGLSLEERCRLLFGSVWRHLVAYPDSCGFYVQYYYSPYYRKYSAAEHSKTWQQLHDDLSVAFRKQEDARPILGLVLHTMLSLAHRGRTDPRQDDDETINRHFETVYSFLAPRLKLEAE